MYVIMQMIYVAAIRMPNIINGLSSKDIEAKFYEFMLTASPTCWVSKLKML